MARFQREAEVLASLNHPNIAQIHGLEKTDGAIALVMELVEGPTLADRIAQGAIPIDEAIAIAKQIAHALEAAHERGIVHRDLKPANVKVRPDGAVKVLDFGLAKSIAGGSADSGVASRRVPVDSPTITTPAMTQAGLIMGTAAYMSPEQAKGRAVDRRADIWAFGCVLYEMLTGRRAFGGDDISDVLVAVMRDEPDLRALPSSTPAQVTTLLRRCLQKDPQKRLPHIGVARLELAEDGGAEAPGDVPVPAPVGIFQRAGWAAIGALVIGAIAWWLRPSPAADAPPATIRFEIPPPDGGRFPGGNNVPRFAVAPDGASVIYQASVDKTFGLWLRRLDATEARLIPGSEGQDDRSSEQPFWSPDGRSIAFFDQNTGQLKKLDLQGGVVQALAKLPGNQYAGAWTADGTLLFATNQTGGIRRVSASGGEVTQVTRADVSRGEQHLWPDVLPGSRLFIYLSTFSGNASAIHVASLDGGAATRLVESAGMGRFAAPDRVLFMRGEALVAQRLDLEGLRLVGEPSLVANPVLSTPSGRVAVSASTTGVLAYAAGVPVRDTAEVVAVDRTGKPLGSTPIPTTPGGVRLSRDGRWLTFGRLESTDTAPDLWLLDTVRDIPTRVAARAIEAVFSPDASLVAYRTARTGGGWTINERAVSGAAPAVELVSVPPAHLVSPLDWSPDGRFLLYSGGEPTRRGLFLLPSSGDRTPRPLPVEAGEFAGASISADGRWVAYAAGREADSQVYVQPFPEMSGGRWAVSGPGGSRPRWRRDGRELYFLSDGGALMAVPVTLTPRFEAGRPAPLFDLQPIGAGLSGQTLSPYDVAPDGQRFFVQRRRQEVRPTPLTVVLNWAEASAAARLR
jgi:Tol biopolymer transport system component